MINKFSLFVALSALYFLAPSINGQDCIPASVLTLRISANAVLSWDVTPKEPCVIDEFQVDVVGDREDSYHFKVKETYVDLSFLYICEEWHFVVTPISNGVMGYERRLVDYIPLPPDADLDIRPYNVIRVGAREVLLQWELMDDTLGDCTLRYRVTIEDMETGEMQDIYFPERSAVLDLSPCVAYQFTVRAVNRAHPTIEGRPRNRDYQFAPLPEDPPTLSSIEVGATAIDMKFNLEEAGRNRCPVRTFYVNGGNYFNLSIPIHDDFDERPPVEVNLKGLRPNSMYFFRASVENSGGISQPAQIAVQTLELNPSNNE